MRDDEGAAPRISGPFLEHLAAFDERTDDGGAEAIRGREDFGSGRIWGSYLGGGLWRLWKGFARYGFARVCRFRTVGVVLVMSVKGV